MRYRLFDEEEQPSTEPLETIATGLKQARDKIQEALAIIRGLPESSLDEQIANFDNTAERLEMKMDELSCSIQ